MAQQTVATSREVYVIGERVAVGGMAEVFRARAVSSGKDVVVKRLLRALAADRGFMTMLVDEARLGGRVSHPNLVPTLDLGTVDGSPCVVFPFVGGPLLGELLPGLTLPARDAVVLHVVGEIARALHHLHTLVDDDGVALGVVHRDVCPQNILVGTDGVARLIDLGIAKAAPQARMTVTPAGIIKGRFAYLAPELARGGPVDGRADVFALGVVLYEALTGQRAWGEVVNDFELLERIRKVEVTPLAVVRPDLHPSLASVLDRVLVREPEDRLNADDFADAIAAAAQESGQEASAADVAAAVGAGRARPGVSAPSSTTTLPDDLEALPPTRR